MTAPAPVADTGDLSTLLIARRSLRAFSPRPVEASVLQALLEAARWAASAYNEQPWRYLVTEARLPEDHARLTATLVPANRAWAEAAPVLVLAVAKRDLDATGGANRHAFHDLGQASAQMALQATALGLTVHQMAGFNIEAARTAFAVPEGHDPVTVIAIGYPGAPEQLPQPLREREVAPRQRKPLSQIAFSGTWGRPVFDDAAQDVVTPDAP